MASDTRVWNKFIASGKNGHGKFRIQDMPSGRLDEVIDLFMKYFILEETWHKASGIHKSESAQAVAREVWTNRIATHQNNMLICCVDDDSDVVGEIVGAALMNIAKKDDPEDDFSDLAGKSKEFAHLLRIVEIFTSNYDVFKEQQIDSLYDDIGVVVHPKYRGFGIAQKFFNARRKVCQAEGVPLTAAWMSTAGSQIAAARDGWEVAYEFSYEEFGKENGLTFENVPPTCKYMVARPLPID
ncbi:hypothetical protein ABMA28_015111 [Loxostege sticticalis]|uniref:N-acetyltransferase domain-containing protein n=1 Tax=Loxostege sticticalis TaxID=481309 RepID=A0ABD0TED4_LOXSC